MIKSSTNSVQINNVLFQNFTSLFHGLDIRLCLGLNFKLCCFFVLKLVISTFSFYDSSKFKRQNIKWWETYILKICLFIHLTGADTSESLAYFFLCCG